MWQRRPETGALIGRRFSDDAEDSILSASAISSSTGTSAYTIPQEAGVEGANLVAMLLHW